MKSKLKKSGKQTLSDKIADALTVKPRADIEDDQVFGTKPHTVSRDDLSSSDSEVDATISDFRKRNVNLLSEISKKYEGQVVSREEIDKSQSQSEAEYEGSDSEVDTNVLTVQDLLLNEDSGSSDDEDESSIQKKQSQNKKTKTNGVDVSMDESKCPSKSIKKSATASIKQLSEKGLNNSKINAILKSIGSFETHKKKNSIIEEEKLSPTDSEVTSEDESEEEDYSISEFQKQLNKSPGKKQSQQLKDSLTDTAHSSDKCESDDYSIHQKDESSGEEGEDGGESGEDEGYDISQMEEPPKEELFEHVKKQNISEDAKKGACVRNQLLIWEGLLEMRIHLQRCMNTANQMPLPDTSEELRKDNEFAEECNVTKNNITNVLDKFLTLQNVLLKSYPETKSLATNSKKSQDPKQETKKDESDEEIPSDTDNEEIPSDTEDDEPKDPKSSKTNDSTSTTPTRKRKLEDYETELSKSHKSFKTFRDTTIQKWNEKTRLATANSIKNTPTNTILQQISYILSDREKLIKRTQLKRSEYEIIGYTKPSKEENHEQNGEEMPVAKDRKDDDEYISEIFDDSDFYHQLLRELIECKSADISDPVQLSRQWIALQQMRSKMKRKVDTKATKGRKIKYVVHNKLVNFMAPEKCTTWTDESTNELYSSLFGKLFENNNVGFNANLENGFKIKN